MFSSARRLKNKPFFISHLCQIRFGENFQNLQLICLVCTFPRLEACTKHFLCNSKNESTTYRKINNVWSTLLVRQEGFRIVWSQVYLIWYVNPDASHTTWVDKYILELFHIWYCTYMYNMLQLMNENQSNYWIVTLSIICWWCSATFEPSIRA